MTTVVETGSRLRAVSPRQRAGARLFPYLLIAPTLILLLTFTLFPLAEGAWSSLFKRGLVVAPSAPETWPVFVGLDNYLALLSDPGFRDTFLKTVAFVVSSVPLLIVVSLSLALLLKHTFPGIAAVRAVVFFPAMISLLIVGIVWKWLLGFNSGFVNYLLSLLNAAPVPWLEGDLLAQAMVVFVWVWANAGFYMMIFITGLMAIPADYYEAAAIDGATAVQSLFRITLPLLRPTLLVVMVLGSIEAFKVYELVVSLTHGGPGRATVYLVQNIYETAFQQPAGAGYAAAQSAVLFVVLMGLTLVQLRVARER